MNKLSFTYASDKEHNLAQRLVIKTIESLTGKKKLEKLYNNSLNEKINPRYLWKELLKILEIQIVNNDEVNHIIPSEGPLIVIANHPFGIIDGLILCSIIADIRADFKIMTHETLQFFPDLNQYILPVNFSKNTKSIVQSNIKIASQAKEHVLQGGVLIIFPSGSVSVAENLKSEAKDDEWKIFPAKLIQQTKADILPFYFEGKNGLLFHLFASKFKNQTLKYSSYIHETRRKIGKKIYVNGGNLIKYSEISHITDRKQLTKYLKRLTYNLKDTNEFS